MNFLSNPDKCCVDCEAHVNQMYMLLSFRSSYMRYKSICEWLRMVGRDIFQEHKGVNPQNVKKKSVQGEKGYLKMPDSLKHASEPQNCR